MDPDDFKFVVVDLQVKEDEVEVAVISERWVLEENLVCYPTNVDDTSLWEKMVKQHVEPEEHSGKNTHLDYISHENQKDMQ